MKSSLSRNSPASNEQRVSFSDVDHDDDDDDEKGEERRSVRTGTAVRPANASSKIPRGETPVSLIDRFLQGDYASRLRDLVQSGDEKIRERLFIDLNPETRRGRVKLDDTIFKATLYDLPCVTESYKTFDRKTMYKIADVAQVSLFSPVLDGMTLFRRFLSVGCRVI